MLPKFKTLPQEKVMCLKMYVAETQFNYEAPSRTKLINQILHYPVEGIQGCPTNDFKKHQRIRINLSFLKGKGLIDAAVKCPTPIEAIPRVFIVKIKKRIYCLLVVCLLFLLQHFEGLKSNEEFSQIDLLSQPSRFCMLSHIVMQI